MMSHISSINFQKSKDFQVFHNATERPDYAIGGEIICNRKGYEALKIKQEIIANAIESYNATKKAKAPSFKAKSYEWSAVCNIKPDTTIQVLEKLAKHFSDKYGFQCYQIAIHRDEGHIDDDGNKVINHHAHLEFITLDKETGKNNYNRQKISPKVLREIQTETAQILQMERGIDKRLSGRERVEPRKYAQMKEQERKALRELKERDKEAQEQILSLKEQKARLEQERKAWIEEKTHTAEEYKALRALAQKGKSAETLELQILALKREIAERNKTKEKFLSAFFTREGIDSKGAMLVWGARYDKGEFEYFFSDNQTLREQTKTLKQENENLKTQINALECDLKHEKQKNEYLLAKQAEIDFRLDSERFVDTNIDIQIKREVPPLDSSEDKDKARQELIQKRSLEAIERMKKQQNNPKDRDMGMGR